MFAGFGESTSANVGTQNVTQDGWTLSDQTHSASNYTFSGASMQIVIMTHDNDLYMKVITNDKLSLLSNVYNVGSPRTLWQFIDFSRLTV